MKSKFIKLMMIVGSCILISACHASPQTKSQPKTYTYLSNQQIVQQFLSQLVFVKGGGFMMGTNDPKYIDLTGDNTPAHPVILSSFYMQKYLMAWHLYNSYLFNADQKQALAKNLHNFPGAKQPTLAHWQQAQDFCLWLSQQTGLPVSLATEAQWEYAARDGGKNIVYATDNGKIEPGINFPTEKSFIYRLKHPNALGQMIGMDNLNVNEIPVNQLGIHQMGGNVSEWVKDWYSPVYYQHSPLHNPQGPNQTQAKIQNGSQLGKFGVYAANDDQLYRVTRGLDGSVINGPATGIIIANNYFRANGPVDGVPGMPSITGFRCVINSDLPLQQLKQIAAVHLKK